MFDYCIEEIEIHYEALVRMHARHTKNQAIMYRTAANADKKGFQRYTKQLDDTWRRIELAHGRSVSKPENLFGALAGMKGKPGRKKGR